MAKQDHGGGCGCLCLLLLAGSFYWWSHGHTPTAKAEAEQAVVSGSAPEPSTVDAVVVGVNPARAEFNEDRAEDAARSSLSGSGYEETLGSGDCTEDCGGHDAGWKWAQDGNGCGGGSSDSFDQGCEAFETSVQDRVGKARQAYEDGDDTFVGDGD